MFNLNAYKLLWEFTIALEVFFLIITIIVTSQVIFSLMLEPQATISGWVWINRVVRKH